MKDLRSVFQSFVHQADHITVLTGAGMSTESGIPDFRSAGGIWAEDMSRMEAMSRSYFEQYPKRFWPKFKGLFQMKASGNHEPNKGHLYLAELEKQGKSIEIFTQNIDGLHKKAGSRYVYELHGSIQTGTCPKCQTKYDLSHLLKEDVPRCTRINEKGTECGFIVKTDVVLFGDMVHHLDTLFQTIEKTDLLLVIGTSLEVAPVNLVPQEAHYIQGLNKALVNLEPTAYDDLFDLVIHEKIGELVSDMKRKEGT
ncbi:MULTISPECIES: NAD-dependent protein deacylase [Bacillus]|uniref:protein acetyllysine N-acetyltransferase n=2 Tax=Bacillus TaxID=1386 RepID=A0A0M4FHL6_9BACI|nr:MULTISPECIES: NAD-dependent protein deacylase [Bacillus]ALC80579.1 NAD-dependent deacetylase [Bacillus gobiensis]MBP1083669.1 NAD-dependent deacetylase [Bacillus capparidis]MED1094861.1 NAD-dependent protein deacylase [Bacillus capparidis]